MALKEGTITKGSCHIRRDLEVQKRGPGEHNSIAGGWPLKFIGMDNPKSEIRAQLQAIAQVFSANTGVRKSSVRKSSK